MTSPEQIGKGAEHKTGALEQAAAERSAELKERQHETGEKHRESAERSAEEARAEVSKEALSKDEISPAEQHKNAPDSHVINSAATRDKAYQQTMQNIQEEMSPTSRTFSKIIHNPAVERVSEVVGSTVARPNAILSGSLVAFLLVLAVYSLAKYMGFSLSGFETIAAFIVGWLLGILFDLIRGMIKGRR